MKKLLLMLVCIRDPRGGGNRRRHDLKELLAAAIMSVFCGMRTFNSMEDFTRLHLEWLRKHGLKFEAGVPSHDTFNRCISRIDPNEFEVLYRKWVTEFRKTLSDEDISELTPISIDGKAIRRAVVNGKHPIIVSAMDGSIPLMQEQVAEKSNEITAVPHLLAALNLANRYVTLDAMGCQKSIAKIIVENGGQYILAMKGNHEHDFHALQCLMTDEIKSDSKKLTYAKTIGKDHGRIEIRECWHLNDLQYFFNCKDWPGMKSVCRVRSTRMIKDQTSTEERIYICSKELDAKDSLTIIRAHWGIENKLHHKLDVQLREDESRARTRHAPRNLSLMRRMALTVLTTMKPEMGLERYQKMLCGSVDLLSEAIERMCA